MRIALVGAALLSALTSACGSIKREVNPATVALSQTPLWPLSSKKALVIGIDGVRPDALLAANTPNLRLLADTGAATYDAMASDSTWSAPAWATVLTGVEYGKHGAANNKFERGNFAQYPDFFTRLEAAHPELATARISSWSVLNDRIPSGADEVYRFDYKTEDDFAAVETTRQLLRDQTKDVDALFVHLTMPDVMGHRHGFAPDIDEYLEAIALADEQVGDILHELVSRPTFGTEDWLVVVTTDHGGTPDRRHGKSIVEHRRIFVIVSGPGVERGALSPAPGLADVAPSVLEHFGVEMPELWALDGQGLRRRVSGEAQLAGDR
jgi:predicted AlkP superfamily pyrophosphatase or phosphodiesterase